MVGITREEAEHQLAFWLKASEAVSKSQAYTIATESGSRSLTRADAAVIRAQILFWDKRVRRLSSGGLPLRSITIDYD